MKQLSQTYYSSKHVIYWFADIMIKCLGRNAHLEPLVLAHIYLKKKKTPPLLSYDFCRILFPFELL